MTEPEDKRSYAHAFTTHARLIKLCAVIAGFIGAIAGSLLAIGTVRHEGFVRGILILPFATAFMFSWIVTGAAILLAPSGFFKSETGMEYLQKIGTTNVLAARIVVLVFLALSVGLTSFFCWLFYQEFIGKDPTN
jgi:lysylphosphatidylglycerol synthetase-like protein (DUF2156 family)